MGHPAMSCALRGVRGQVDLLKQFEGAAGLEVFGDVQAEGAGGDAGGDFGREADHAFAVGRDDLGLDAPGDGRAGVGDGVRDVVDGGAVDADGELASAAERVEDGALGLDGEARLGVVERGDDAADAVVACGVGGVAEAGVAGGAPVFQRERTLAGCGADLFDGETLAEPLGAVEAVEAGGGQHQRVALAVGQLAQAGVDVAAHLDEAEVGA